LTESEFENFTSIFQKYLVKKDLHDVIVIRYLFAQFFKMSNRQLIKIINEIKFIEETKVAAHEPYHRAKDPFDKIMEKNFPDGL